MLTQISPQVSYVDYQFSQPLSDWMQRVKLQMDSAVVDAAGDIHEACSSMLHSPSKLLRPQLVLLAAEEVMKGHQNEHLPRSIDTVVHYAAAAELIHVASLIHDDVVDLAEQRRGRPSVNSRFGNHTAVLAGDFLFAAAFSLLSQDTTSGGIPLMTRAIQQMCLGELEQKRNLFCSQVTEVSYLSQIRRKTGALLGACTEGGASMAGASSETASRFKRYGEKLGIAFQITDDVLDWEGCCDSLGKPIGQDALQGIYTLPLIRILKSNMTSNGKATSARRHVLQALTRIRKGLQPEKAVSLLRSILMESGTIEDAKQTAREFSTEAIEEIKGIVSEASPLISICRQAVSRVT